MEKEKSFDSSLSVCTKDYKYSKGGESMGEISSKRDFRVLLAQSTIAEKFPYLLDHKDFDPATNSKVWTSPSGYSVYVTAQDGLEESMIRGDSLICVANELTGVPSNVYRCPLDPFMSYTEGQLNVISSTIDSLLKWSNVTVYCAMGMERSPLAVMYWMCNRLLWDDYWEDYRLGSVDFKVVGCSIFDELKYTDNAYELLRNERPIVVDRRSYLEGSPYKV